MAFDYGFDFRQTSGYVSDPANCSPSLGEAYPHTYANGATAGWSSGAPDGTRDRNNLLDARLAGMNFLSSTTKYFQVDITGTGVAVHLAIGDATSTNEGN